jgi:hypothetical protein
MRSCCEALLVKRSHQMVRGAADSAGQVVAQGPAVLYQEIPEELGGQAAAPVDMAVVTADLVVEVAVSVAVGKDLAEGQAVGAEKGERAGAGWSIRRSIEFASAFSIAMRIRRLTPDRTRLPERSGQRFLITTSA